MKRMSLLVLAMVVVLAAGCSTGPHTPIVTWNLGGSHMIYLEQNDRVPVAVPLVAWSTVTNKSSSDLVMRGIDPAIYAEMIRELAKMWPELAKTYSAERANELLISHRVLIKGYKETNELEQIKAIIQTWGEQSEKWMPQK